MQPISKVLLGACAVYTVAQGGHIAYAQPANQPTMPDPAPPSTDPQPPPGSMNEPAPAVPSSDTSATVPPATDPTTTGTTPVTDSTTESRIDMADASSDKFGYAWREPALGTGIGVSAILGGGVSGFTDKTMRSTTADVGGLWDLRVTLGSHIPLALDVSYLGTATNVRAMPAGQSATLIGTTAEAALRYNILPHYDWNPYVFAGAGWQHYDVTGDTPQVIGMATSDDLIEFPVGTGLAYRRSGFVADLRGTFRATTEENLVLRNPATGSDPAPMHTWEASAALGYEF
jgi:hypothetical protein